MRLPKFKEEREERQARVMATIEAQERERKKMQVCSRLTLGPFPLVPQSRGAQWLRHIRRA